MPEGKTAPHGYDFWILVPVLFLAVSGLIIVYSASAHLADMSHTDAYFYLKRQGLFMLVGLCIMIFLKQIPPEDLTKWVIPLLGTSLILLLLVLVLGRTSKGAARWLHIGGFSFQPSELAKLALAVTMAYSMAKKGGAMETFSRGFLPHILLAGVFMVLVVFQRDLGAAVIILLWVLTMLFVGGTKVRYLAGLLVPVIPAVVLLILLEPYRLRRIFAYLDPWEDPQGKGFQIIHSFLAFGSGGLTGVGLGESKQKLLYLPEAHTDFVLSIVGEETGLLGVAVILLAFAILIMRGIKVALRARDLYSTYLTLGLISFLGIQVVINMAVVLGLVPTKGLALPLMSYGGSSLIMNFATIGILLSISSRA